MGYFICFSFSSGKGLIFFVASGFNQLKRSSNPPPAIDDDFKKNRLLIEVFGYFILLIV